MMKKVDFLYPEWTNLCPITAQHPSTQLHPLYTAPFRPGHKVNRLRKYQSPYTTPATALSRPELLCGMEDMPRPTFTDDLTTAPDISAYERDKQRVRNLEAGNRRQLFKRTPCPLVEKGRGSENFIAMGTLWSPASNSSMAVNTNSRDSSSCQTISISNNVPFISKSLVLGPQNNNGNNNSSAHRKPSNPNMRLNHNSSVSGISSAMFGMQLSINSNNCMKDNKCISDPKYSDPLLGAPASFQQRLMELASLEADTIRWERSKKAKKKSKQDRDS